jgi:NTP pyrophosphatase (non-canonical NTP hydrolase)
MENRISDRINDAEKEAGIEDEVADMVIYIFEFADSQCIEIAAALLAKFENTAAKCPVKKVEGSSAKYTDL